MAAVVITFIICMTILGIISVIAIGKKILEDEQG